MRHGFTLVELSIVLVILGLLTGGILAGQALIRQSELRSVIAEAQGLSSAYHTFYSKYQGFPGDLRDATSYWGSAGGTGGDTTCLSAQARASVATCNGNGNLQIDKSASAHDERFLAWKHLGDSLLVSGSYLGRSGTLGSYVQDVGLNVYKAKVNNGFFDFVYIGVGTWAFPESSVDMNFLVLYGNTSSLTVLTTQEAWQIDKKIDDGNPVYGNMNVAPVGSSFSGSTCSTASTGTAEYAVTTSGTLCVPRFALR